MRKKKVDLQGALQGVGLNVIVMPIDNVITDGINDRSHGVAQPTENLRAVEFNHLESTKSCAMKPSI